MKKILGALALLSLVLTAANGQTVNANVQKSTTTNQLVGKNVLPAVQGIVTQTNSFTVGTCLYNDGTGSSGSPHYSLSDNVTAPWLSGVIVQAGTASLPTVIQFLGYQNTITGLAANTQYYLGSSGALTSTAPVTVGYYVIPVMLTGIAGDGEIQIGPAAKVIIQPVVNGGTGITTATAHGVLVGETTAPFNVTAAGVAGQVLTSNGASSDPSFQSVSSGNSVGDTRNGTWIAQPGTGAVNYGLNASNYVNGGTIALDDTYNLESMRATSAATTGQEIISLYCNGVSTDASLSPTITFFVGAVSEAGTNYRYWVGILSTTDNSASDTLTGSGAAFRLSTSAGDGGIWQCVTATGGTQTVTSSGVAATASFQSLKIVISYGVNVKFYINGTLVATNTTNLPTTPCGDYVAEVTPLSNAARILDLYWYCESTPAP